MYEMLYEPLPSVEGYLKRIGIEGKREANLEYLNELIYAHQCQVPFENVDICMCGRPISLDIPALYEKVVTNHRGGYCFELNALFRSLLVSLEYQATPCMCRIIKREGGIIPVSHRGTIVTLADGLYFCDVGFGGPMPAGAVRVEENEEVMLHGDCYHMEKQTEPWWMLQRKSRDGVWEEILQFYTMPQEEVDYVPLNEYSACSEKSIFTKMLFVNKRTEDGSVGILGEEFTRICNHEVVEKRTYTLEELPGLLRQNFGIDLDRV